MKAEKIRNLTDVELKHQEKDLADQLFKLKFQMNMGQTESLKKIRGLRRDIARVQTVLREQELAGSNGSGGKVTAVKTAEVKTAVKKASPKAATVSHASAKKASVKATTAKSKTASTKTSKTEKK
jgi:large subunit ribosomal protein L29